MVKRSFSRGRFWLKSRAERLRRWLGLPALSPRAALLILLGLLALAYVSVSVLSELTTKMKGYAPQYYEPKDIERAQGVQKKNP